MPGILFGCNRQTIIMKKILFGIGLVLVAGTVSPVMAQDSTSQAGHTNMKVKYYFYPAQNVYHNEATGDYWYYDTRATSWKIIRTLPSTYSLNNTEREVVYYNGTDVWRKNELHIKKFKMKNDKIKVKQAND
ncbi:hypothetical protein BH09BAC2_BH09BAC2_23850 [soil metagenome]